MQKIRKIFWNDSILFLGRRIEGGIMRCMKIKHILHASQQVIEYINEPVSISSIYINVKIDI